MDQSTGNKCKSVNMIKPNWIITYYRRSNWTITYVSVNWEPVEICYHGQWTVLTASVFVPPPSPNGQEWDYWVCQHHMFVRSCVHSFVHLTHPRFPDSHSWIKPHRIFPLDTMIDHIKTLPGIVCQLPSPIFDLVITYFLSLELLSRLSFLNKTT